MDQQPFLVLRSQSRQKRSLIKSALNSLDHANASMLRLVVAVEALEASERTAGVGTKARDVAQSLHEIREVLVTWMQNNPALDG